MASDTLLKYEARPEAGIHFAYLVYLPKGLRSHTSYYLMVETNNTGLNDSIPYHAKGARHAACKSGFGNYIARKLQLPLLIRIFPRSKTNRRFYTLDRDVLLT